MTHSFLKGNPQSCWKVKSFQDFPGSSGGKESACNSGDPQFNPWVRKMPWRRDRLPTSLGAQMVKNSPAMREVWVQSLGWEDLLEEAMATHSSILAWRIPMDRGAWWVTVHGVVKSWTQLSE